MNKLREAAQQALEAMGSVGADWICEASHHAERDQHKIGEPCPLQQRWHVAYQALRAALAEPVQEPVGVLRTLVQIHPDGTETWREDPVWIAPPKRKPLKEEEIYSLFRTVASPVMFARAIERAHGIGEHQ